MPGGGRGRVPWVRPLWSLVGLEPRLSTLPGSSWHARPPEPSRKHGDATRGPAWPHPHAHLMRRYRYAMLISTSPRLSTTSRRHPALVAATMARGAARRLSFVPTTCRTSFLAPCLDSAPGGANSGTILPGGSSGFVVDSRGRPGASGSRQAAPVSSLLGLPLSERSLQLSKILRGSRIVDSENRPLWIKSTQSLQGGPRRRQSAFFGLS